MHKNSRHHFVINKIIKGAHTSMRVSLKTRPADWIGTYKPVILPFSIYSSLYEGIMGEFKVAAFLKMVKANVKGKITFLLCEGAHLETLSIKYSCKQDALKACCEESKNILKRFKEDLEGYEMVSWIDFITKDTSYNFFKKMIYELYEENSDFQMKVKCDAEKINDSEFLNKISNKKNFFRKNALDLLEQCIYLMVVHKKGYRFEFYPGKRTSCVDFVNSRFLNEEDRIKRINVTIGTPTMNVKTKSKLAQEIMVSPF